MQRRKITRESILEGRVRDFVEDHPELRRLLLPEEERRASLEAILARARSRDDVWVFAYGSLIWNPAFHFVERRIARVHGYHRRFCLWTAIGRGSLDNPGLLLGLERGGACRGLVYRIAEPDVETELDIIWRREMLTGAYHPTWVSAHTESAKVPAITFVINRDNNRYAGRLSEDRIARVIASAHGTVGPCCEYLFETVEHLHELGIRDHRLEAMARKVRAHQGSD